MSRYGLEKMKTIGDSYMFVSGMPERRPSHPVDAVLAALEMVEAVRTMARPEEGINWQMRVGLHTGPVIAGVVGIHKFAFDVWGDSVNFSSRMESSGAANRVNLSERTHSRVKDFIRCTPRGRVLTKDGREVDMFFVDGVYDKLMDTGVEGIPSAFARRYKIYFQQPVRAFPAFLLPPEFCRAAQSASKLRRLFRQGRIRRRFSRQDSHGPAIFPTIASLQKQWLRRAP